MGPPNESSSATVWSPDGSLVSRYVLSLFEKQNLSSRSSLSYFTLSSKKACTMLLIEAHSMVRSSDTLSMLTLDLSTALLYMFSRPMTLDATFASSSEVLPSFVYVLGSSPHPDSPVMPGEHSLEASAR